MDPAACTNSVDVRFRRREQDMSIVVRSRFHLFMAIFAAVLVFAGFSRSYYLRPLFDRPPLTVLLHTHAVIFTAWIVLFLVQVRLVAARRIRWHRQLGLAGGVVAVLMVLITGATIIEAMRVGNLIGGIPAWQFVAKSSVSIVLFAGLVGAALLLRRRPEWHRRLMTVATIGILGPATGRLLIMIGGTEAARHASTLSILLLATCLAHDWFRHRIVHPAYVLGAVTYVVAIPLKQMLADSGAWAGFARWVMAG
jgi:hypothetical protein